MSVAVSIISTVLKSVIGSKVGNELINELIGISIDDASEKGINKINDFINEGKSKIDYILSGEKMKSMDIPEDNIVYVVAEIKELLSNIEITDEIFRQYRYDSLKLYDFLWNEYSENKTYIECESDIKKSLLSVSETLIKVMCESEEFVQDISIQISNTVDDIKGEMREGFNVLIENQKEILQKSNEKIINQDEIFINNKKQDYIKIWNSRLFLHVDNDEKPITLADAFILPDYDFRTQLGRIKFLETDTLGEVISKFVKYNVTSSLLITGAPGIGKTSITAWMANEFKEDDDIIILRFRDWTSEELDVGLLKAICNTLECDKLELENKILILDGFDEIKAMDGRDSLLNRFFNDILDFGNFKIIVTSRPNYVDSHRFNNFFNLLPFNVNKIREFYQLIKGEELKNCKINHNNINVIGIPVILYMAIMSDINFAKRTTKPELYSRIFAERGGIFDKFCCDGIGYDKGSHILRDKENINIYLCFLGEVAFKMFEKDNLTLYKDEYKIPELSFQGTPIPIMEFPIKYIFESTEYNIEFIHKSIYEYFISEYIYNSIYNVINKNISKEKFAGVLGTMFKENILSYETLEFFKYKIRYSLLNEKFDLIREVFQIMLQDGMTYYLGKFQKKIIDCEMRIFKNMLDILHLWNKTNLEFDDSIVGYIKYNYKFHLNLIDVSLREKDFRKVDLTKVILNGADLRKADLSEADLKGIDLREANLEEADLSESNMIGANLVETNLRKANLLGTNLDKANMKSADLQDAILIGTSLKRVDLRKANLRGVDLRRANLEDVDLREANISEIILDEIGVNNLKNEYNLESVRVLFATTQEVMTYEEYCKKSSN